ITIDMILDERSKELFAEGHRFFDMIRLNKSITFNDDFQGVPVAHREKTIDRGVYKTILPIADSEIKANPGLASQQNPGYYLPDIECILLYKPWWHYFIVISSWFSFWHNCRLTRRMLNNKIRVGARDY